MKKFTVYIILTINLGLWSIVSFSQNKTIDSLSKVLLSSEIDTNKVNTLNSLAWELRTINPDSSILLTNQAISILTGIKKYQGKWKQIATASSWYLLGDFYLRKGDYASSLNYNLKALDLWEVLEEEVTPKQLHRIKELKSLTRSNIGDVYKDQGEYNKALDNYFKGLKIDEELKNENGKAQHFCNIGNIYYALGDCDKALKYYFNVLKIGANANLGSQDAFVLANIGNVYLNIGEYNKALDYNLKALKKHEELVNKDGIAFTLGNIGSVYHSMGNYSKALDYHNMALKIGTELKDKKRIAIQHHSIAMLFFDEGKYGKAKENLLSSLKISSEIGWNDGRIVNYYRLSILDSTLGNFKEAYMHYKLYEAYNDSLTNKDNLKKQTQLEMNFEFEKREALTKAEQEKKDALAKEEIAHQRMQRNYFMIGFGLVLLLAFLIYRGYRNMHKAKEIISDQKIKVDRAYSYLEEKNKIIAEKNKEITDSINYAQRIQNAMLPDRNEILKLFPDSFVLFKPKDIVSGDFYWLYKTEGKVLIAASDCTGHGVPGAMVSVVCSNALNRTVKEFGITDPGKILDKTREIVTNEFEKSEDEVKDGMDISLCSITGNILKWAGANNPLWIINPKRTSWPDDALPFGEGCGGAEVKPNKQPIGNYSDPKPFVTHAIEWQPGDTIYIFTDGYQDQFGGEKGKKFKASRLKELLLSMQDKTMEEQKEILNNTFENWKGNLEQVDDVCIIGVRV